MHRGKILVGFVLVCASGCIPLSLHPLYTDNELTYRPELEGVWKEESGSEEWRFERADERGYRLTISKDGDEATFSAHLVQLKKSVFLDLIPEDYPLENEWYQMLLCPMHTFFCIELEGDAYRLSTFDPEWLGDRVERGRLWVPHEEISGLDWFVFTASPKRLQRFVLKWVKHPEAFGDPTTFQRAAPACDMPPPEPSPNGSGESQSARQTRDPAEGPLSLES